MTGQCHAPRCCGRFALPRQRHDAAGLTATTCRDRGDTGRLRRSTPFLRSGQYTRLLSTAGSAAAKSVTGFRDRVRYSLYLITVAAAVLVYLRDHQLVYRAGSIRNSDAALANASCAFGALTIPTCSAFLRRISTRQRGISPSRSARRLKPRRRVSVIEQSSVPSAPLIHFYGRRRASRD